MTEPRVGHQGAHNLAGVGVLLIRSLPRRKDRCLLQISHLGGWGMEGNHEACVAQGAAPVKSPGPARILPKLKSVCSQGQLGSLTVEDKHSPRPLY